LDRPIFLGRQRDSQKAQQKPGGYTRQLWDLRHSKPDQLVRQCDLYGFIQGQSRHIESPSNTATGLLKIGHGSTVELQEFVKHGNCDHRMNK